MAQPRQKILMVWGTSEFGTLPAWINEKFSERAARHVKGDAVTRADIDLARNSMRTSGNPLDAFNDELTPAKKRRALAEIQTAMIMQDLLEHPNDVQLGDNYVIRAFENARHGRDIQHIVFSSATARFAEELVHRACVRHQFEAVVGCDLYDGPKACAHAALAATIGKLEKGRKPFGEIYVADGDLNYLLSMRQHIPGIKTVMLDQKQRFASNPAPGVIDLYCRGEGTFSATFVAFEKLGFIDGRLRVQNPRSFDHLHDDYDDRQQELPLVAGRLAQKNADLPIRRIKRTTPRRRP